MFKEILIIIIIIISIVSLNFLMQNYLANSSTDFIKELDELAYKLQEKDDINLDEIKEEVNNLEKKWYGIEDIWMLIILHSDIDKVEEAFKELEAELDIKDKEQAYVKIKKMQFLIESITNKDLFELKNIF